MLKSPHPNITLNEFIQQYLLKDGNPIIARFKASYLSKAPEHLRDILTNPKELCKALSLLEVTTIVNPNNTCLVCHNEVPFISALKGYKRYCSKSCCTKASLSKMQATCLERYGVCNPMYKAEFKAKTNTPESIAKSKAQVIKTCLERYGVCNPMQVPIHRATLARNNLKRYGTTCNLLIPEIERYRALKQHKDAYARYLAKNYPDFKEYQENIKRDYTLYRKLVMHFTRANDVSTLEHYDERGVKGYHLDHCLSVKEGFEQGIPAHIIGSLANLKFIRASENLKKGRGSSTSKAQLFGAYYGCST